MSERPEQSDRPSDQAARVERLLEFDGVDKWFREELAIGLGAAYEANLIYRAWSGTEIPIEDYSQAFFEGTEWAVDRGRHRFADNPSKRDELERTVWKLFGSEEQVGLMFAWFREGRFHYNGASSQETMGIFLVGDMEAFEYKKPQPMAQQAA